MQDIFFLPLMPLFIVNNNKKQGAGTIRTLVFAILHLNIQIFSQSKLSGLQS